VSTIDISVVVPLYDEQDNVEPLHEAVTIHLSSIGRPYELVLVDDGSRDATFERAAAIAARDPHVRVIKLRRNYGQTAALAAGLGQARGKIIVTMDGDLQNDPADVPRLLALIDNGFDLVIGWRRHRHDKPLRVLASVLANWLIALVMGVSVHDSGCSLKALRAELAASLPLYGEMHRFMPSLSRIVGARIAEVEIAHHPRTRGVSKYGYGRIAQVVLDIVSIRFLLSYMARPRLWTGWLVGAAFAMMAALALAALLVDLPPIVSAICSLWLSLALFLAAWSMVGYQIVVLDARGGRFAALIATGREVS
jgi:glycosyltransferase involved in cell wall biosynthesis